MNSQHTAVITGTGVVLPGVSTAAAVAGGKPAGAEPVDPASLVGRKGMRYKDRATRLAYCATDAVLRDAGLLTDDGLTVPAASTGVVASSTLGNVDTVVRAADTIQAETVTGTSPMDLPNASSNVIASSMAIRFGLRGPNLMVCNGATGGLDAVRWAVTMLAAGRAERMLVLGVEPDTEEARALLGAPGLDGAVALVVETPAAAAARGVSAGTRVGAAVRGRDTARCLERLSAQHPDEPPEVWYLSGSEVIGDPLPGVTRTDPSAGWGSCVGALGVLQCAAAVGAHVEGVSGTVYATAGAPDSDATAGLALLPEVA